VLLSRVDGQLVGVATLQRGTPVEACGLVHPAWRRRGVGRRLLAAAQVECRRLERGLLLCFDERSASGRAFAEAVGGRFALGEYRLELVEVPGERAWPVPVALREIGPDDAATFAAIGDAANDPDEPFDRRAWVLEGMQRGRWRYYLGELAGEPIATIRCSIDEGPCYVTSFAVLPAHQGRGHGRQVLTKLVRLLAAEGRDPIRIEVATDNPRALGLYRSCGFSETNAYAYYRVAV
jgi:ribosomal protein S18 acetylase RimI-like enzyme